MYLIEKSKERINVPINRDHAQKFRLTVERRIERKEEKQNKKNKHDFRMQEIVQQTTYCNENEEMLPVNCTRNLLLMDVNSRQC